LRRSLSRFNPLADIEKLRLTARRLVPRLAAARESKIADAPKALPVFEIILLTEAKDAQGPAHLSFHDLSFGRNVMKVGWPPMARFSGAPDCGKKSQYSRGNVPVQLP
jgi:hypothetical protein